MKYLAEKIKTILVVILLMVITYKLFHTPMEWKTTRTSIKVYIKDCLQAIFFTAKSTVGIIIV